ncbi:MAG: type VI secretion system tube protein Hcp [Candidatus Acidiferrum sp.]
MAFDAYLKLDGVEGESQKEGHTKEIELTSWSWGGSNSGSFAHGSGGGTGKYSTNDLACSAYLSKASPKLFQACTKGTHIDKGILAVRKTGGDAKPYDYLKITLEHCLVASYSTGGGSGSDEMGLEQFSLNFSKITFEYFVQDASKGTVSSTGAVSYDLAKAQAA